MTQNEIKETALFRKALAMSVIILWILRQTRTMFIAQTKTPPHKAGAQLYPYFTEPCAVLADKMNLNKGEARLVSA